MLLTFILKYEKQGQIALETGCCTPCVRHTWTDTFTMRVIRFYISIDDISREDSSICHYEK